MIGLDTVGVGLRLNQSSSAKNVSIGVIMISIIEMPSPRVDAGEEFEEGKTEGEEKMGRPE